MRKSLQLLCCFFLLVFQTTAIFAICPIALPGRWRWPNLEVFNHSTVAPADLNAAMTAWNQAQSKLTFVTSAGFLDVQIWNDNGAQAGVFPGLTRRIPFGPGALCYQKVSNCGTCFTSDAIYRADVFVNHTEIQNFMNRASACGVTYTLSQVHRMVLTHELGHVLGLNHNIPTAPWPGCTEISDSVMYGLARNLVCNVLFPRTCDINLINLMYPTRPANCILCSSQTCTN